MNNGGVTLDSALELVDRAQAAPRDVLRRAAEIIDTNDGETAAIGWWAKGLAERELGDTAASERAITAAIEQADVLDMPQIAARMRDSLAFTLFLLGNHSRALEQTELAAPLLTGQAAARLQMQRALILQRLGRTDDALDAYRSALRRMTAAKDRLGEARLRINRSNIYTYRWELHAAAADLQRAHELASELDQEMLVAGCAHNLGFVEGRRGQIPAALEWFERARTSYSAAGVKGGLAAVLDVDHAQLLLDVGLAEEALEAARRAAALLDESGNAADRAEAVLLSAQAALAAQQLTTARTLAQRAQAEFSEQSRPAWEARARYVDVQAHLRELLDTPDAPDRAVQELGVAARAAATALRRHGWNTEAMHATIIEARAALATDDTTRARRLLDSAPAARRRGPIDARITAWQATALLRYVDGNHYGARRALMAGLRLLDESRALLGAAELRASIARHASELVEFGITLALETERTDHLFSWVDAARAGAIRLHPTRPPRDAALAKDLTELRRLDQEAQAAALNGDSPDTTVRQMTATERRIRERARRHMNDGTPTTAQMRAGLRDRLGDAAIVEYFSHRGRLHAVVATRSDVRHTPLVGVDGIASQADRARFDLARMAHGRGSRDALTAAFSSLNDVGAHLEDVLLSPLNVGDRPLIIVPAGPLHGLPWRTLPGLQRRPFSLAPSALAWATAARRHATKHAATLVAAGPDLEHAGREADAVARLHPNVQRLEQTEATVDRVLRALERSDTAHLIAHGEFRHDSPMFSSLRMYDGPLTVYDMERLHRVPKLITLPACDAAVTGLRPGEELLGFSAALLALGVRTLIAPQIPIPDAETPALMHSLHAQLSSGVTPSAALASVVEGALGGSPRRIAAALAFVAIGA